MSIKFFHLFFIGFCTLFSGGVGIYCLWFNQGEVNHLVGVGVFFLVLGCVLLAYGFHFYRKWRKAGLFL